LPEPPVTEYVTDVADVAETAESLTMAFLVMLEKLSPLERAAFGDARRIRIRLRPDRSDRRLEPVELLLGLFRHAHRLGLQLRIAEVNGQPSAQCLDPAGGLINVISLDIADGAIQVVRSIVNLDELRHLGHLSPIGRRSGA
jgi:hypothetical protein